MQPGSVVRKFRITAADGKSYDTQHYNLPTIIAVGYKVNSERAVQFRKWATTANEDGNGGDDAADALRYSVATRGRTIPVRKLVGA